MSKKLLKHCEDNLELIKERKDSLYSLKSLCTLLGYSDHGRNTGVLASFCKQNSIDISHFTSNGKPRSNTLEKICPVCNNTFYTLANLKEKTTCSHQCANTYFKQAEKIDVSDKQYAYRAKRAGMTSCCVCGEEEVIDIHHIDEDRNNNLLDNLMPLCPTHHAYIHRGLYSLIEEQILNYLDNRIIAE